MKLIENTPLIKRMAIINRLPFFKSFSLDERQVLLESFSSLLLVKKDRFVFQQFDNDKSLYLVLSGVLMMFRHNDKVELGLVEPGEFIGEGSFVSQRQRSINARACEDTILLAISSSVLSRLPSAMKDKLKDQIIIGMSHRIEQLSKLLEAKQS